MGVLDTVLASKPADIKRPTPLPAGTYLVAIIGRPEFVTVGKDKTDAVEYTAKIIQAQADVDPNAIRDFEATIGPIQGREFKGNGGIRFFLTEQSLYRLNDWMVDVLGIDPGDRGMRERIMDPISKQCLVTITHQPSADGKTLYQQVSGFGKV